MQPDVVDGDTKSMEDIPLEVVTIILYFLLQNESTRNNSLGYRLVNHQWKDILDSIISKRISSGDYPAFPEMKIFGAGRTHQFSQLHVWINKNNNDQNVIPFNSLVLSGNRNAADFNKICRPRIPLSLRKFFSTFAKHLTIFALHDQIIPFKNLASILKPMASLKQLMLLDVRIPKSLNKPIVPTLPILPNLVTLEVKSSFNWNFRDGRRNVLYIWLVASYADQLDSLSLNVTRWPFPPLLMKHLYSHQSFPIARTSDLAFKNLKNLRVLNASLEFMRQSEMPALRKLTLIDVWGHTPNLLNIIPFLNKLANTLEKLCLDVSWDNLIGNDAFEGLIDWGEFQLYATRALIIPNLKVIAIHYPPNGICEEILNRFLLRFPALEKLELLSFQCLDFEEIYAEWDNPVIIAHLERLQNQAIEEGEHEVGNLKERLSLVWQEMETAKRNLDEAYGNLEIDGANGNLEINVLKRAMIAVMNEGTVIFQRLDALGEKKEKVIVEQLLERREIWFTCPNLQVVSVFSRGEPPQDVVCRLNRQQDEF